jgi:hypothetical protein
MNEGDDVLAFVAGVVVGGLIVGGSMVWFLRRLAKGMNW